MSDGPRTGHDEGDDADPSQDVREDRAMLIALIAVSVLAVAAIIGSLTDRRAIGRRAERAESCLLYTSPSPRDLSTSRMPSSA